MIVLCQVPRYSVNLQACDQASAQVVLPRAFLPAQEQTLTERKPPFLLFFQLFKKGQTLMFLKHKDCSTFDEWRLENRQSLLARSFLIQSSLSLKAYSDVSFHDCALNCLLPGLFIHCGSEGQVKV